MRGNRFFPTGAEVNGKSCCIHHSSTRGVVGIQFGWAVADLAVGDRCVNPFQHRLPEKGAQADETAVAKPFTIPSRSAAVTVIVTPIMIFSLFEEF